ncbi:MAG: hypothetical protein AAB516_01980 [Patescibacteria group bacterium]
MKNFFHSKLKASDPLRPVEGILQGVILGVIACVIIVMIALLATRLV